MQPTAIEIVPYDPRWPEEFRQIAAALRAALGEVAARIDHIGSTSVPWLAAKNIIDVQVSVAALDAETIAPLLAPLGYTPRPDLTCDHVPPGADDAPEQWAKLFSAPRPRSGAPTCTSAAWAAPTNATPCSSATICAPIRGAPPPTGRSRKRWHASTLRHRSLPGCEGPRVRHHHARGRSGGHARPAMYWGRRICSPRLPAMMRRRRLNPSTGWSLRVM